MNNEQIAKYKSDSIQAVLEVMQRQSKNNQIVDGEGLIVYVGRRSPEGLVVGGAVSAHMTDLETASFMKKVTSRMGGQALEFMKDKIKEIKEDLSEDE